MRFLHTMIRVGNLERSIEFYTKVMGLEVVKQKDYPGGRFTLAFLGIKGDPSQATIELTYNWDTESYDLGNGFGHLAFEVPDIYQVCDAIKEKGGIVTREPGPMKHGTTEIAFVKDPDGYQIELIQKSA